MRLVSSGDEAQPSFFMFDGNIWRHEADISFQKDLRVTSYQIVDKLCVYLKNETALARQQGRPVEELDAVLKSLRAAKIHIQRSNNIRSITAAAKQLMWDDELASKLDQNSDLLACANGIIHLPTGTLRRGSPEDFVSKALKIDFRGLEFPTPAIDEFFHSIFEDRDVEQYVQSLLGYAITGHTKEQKFIVMTGCGSNGASLSHPLKACHVC